MQNQPRKTHGLDTRLAVAVAAGLASTLALAAPVRAADEDNLDIEIPVLILEDTAGATEEGDEALDLANIVQTAAKGVTTVQEAPAIVTVITNDEIRQRNFATLELATDAVPGNFRVGGLHSQFTFPTTRGMIQGILFLKDGVSMFSPWENTPSVYRVQPMETVKRIEFITGPGGVLWGANSFLGIMNVITKDAEDIDGVEAGVTAGDGNGDRSVMRGYVMAGIPELFNEKSSLMVHSSFETFIGPGFEMPLHMFSVTSPNPNSDMFYGPFTRAQPPRSFLFNFDGKLKWGDLSFNWQLPFGQHYTPLGFPGFVSVEDRVEDSLVMCSDESYALPGQCPEGSTQEGLRCPRPGTPEGDAIYGVGNYYDDVCLDPDHRARANRIDWYERYGFVEHRTRFAEGKAGLTSKAYFVQFNRPFNQLGILAPVAGLIEGGVAFTFDASPFRAGGQIDGDVELPQNLRLLYGAEGMHDWSLNNVEEARGGDGVQSTFIGPYEIARLPFSCPIQRHFDPDTGQPDGTTEFVPSCPMTFMFPSSRTTVGAYTDAQWRPGKKLILDAGVRLQYAPEDLGTTGYGLQPIFSGAAVYNFAKDWHLKANYTEGFRPPTFNALFGNGDGIEIGGSPDLKNEQSRAWQGEINARLFKGRRMLRELNFRADYSYTVVDNFIQITGGRYANADQRAMHEAEFLGKLYLRGGHRVELGYTWLRMNTADRGIQRALPENWFNLTGIFQLSEDILATTNLRVLGAFEDPNRIIEYRIYGYDEFGRVINTTNDQRELIISHVNDMTLDRIPPDADLTLGLSYTGIKRLQLNAIAYNALNGRNFQPDVFHDYMPRYEILPNPYEDFRFYVNATYNY